MWDKYCQAWSATNPQRQELLESSLTPTFKMTGNTNIYSGYDGLQQAMDSFQARQPGAVFKTKGPLIVHHEYAKVVWECVDAKDKRVVGGMDVLEYAEDGRICKMIAFLD